MMQHQPFHLVHLSPWPIMMSVSIGSQMISMIYFFNMNNYYMIYMPTIATLMIMTSWWRDVSREATFIGNHSNYVQEGLEWGMLMFISSEVMFFFAFFWSFYHSSLSPNIELGVGWPAKGIMFLDPFSVPLLNTLVLLTSGATVTVTHSIMMKNPSGAEDYMNGIMYLLSTIFLGLYFTFLQYNEYKTLMFTIADGMFGSVFYMATGFHGIHVIVGSIMLSSMLLRMWKNQFSSNHHFGFEAAAWYWHFVDVVWIFLYINLYWWTASL